MVQLLDKPFWARVTRQTLVGTQVGKAYLVVGMSMIANDVYYVILSDEGYHKAVNASEFKYLGFKKPPELEEGNYTLRRTKKGVEYIPVKPDVLGDGYLNDMEIDAEDEAEDEDSFGQAVEYKVEEDEDEKFPVVESLETPDKLPTTDDGIRAEEVPFPKVENPNSQGTVPKKKRKRSVKK